jgi:protein-tyrosine-phosphatase
MPESVLFVDRGNNCLSAIAQYAFCRATALRVPVSSAGLSVSDAFLHMHARELLRDEGLDFEEFLSFRGKTAGEREIAFHDLVLAFNEQDLRELRGKFPSHAAKMHLITAYCGESGEISDPCAGKAGKAGEQERFLKAYADLFSLSKKVAQRL